jgi:hypothetical protein
MADYKLGGNNRHSDNQQLVTGNHRWMFHTRPLVPLLIDEGDQYGMAGEQDIDEYPEQEQQSKIE